MGKSSGSAKQQVTEYRLSIHYGICLGSIDKLKAITLGDDKVAWSGSVSGNAIIDINQPQLFGGPKKEGGVGGRAFLLSGGPAQVMPNELAGRFGLTNTTCPAFRGITTIMFVGAGPTYGFGNGYGQVAQQDGAGFYWTANSPFLQDISFTVEVAPKGLNPAKAMIASASQVVVVDTYGHVVTIGAETQVLRDGVPSVVSSSTVSVTVNTADVRGRKSQVITIDGVTITLSSYWIDPKTSIEYDNTSAISVGDVYVPIRNGTASAGNIAVSVSGSKLTLRLPSSQILDANPAHIIYEILTSPDFMACPPNLIDTAAAEQCGDTLFDEKFGLSLLWTQSTEIENFVGEIIDHIQMMLYISPKSGLFKMRLLRADYDVDNLREINSDNATITSFQRKLWGETANEVVVTWTNPLNEAEETVTAQDLGNIAAQGVAISTGRNYYGVRLAELAARLAARDVRASSAPLALVEVTVDRRLWDIEPGDVLRANWPEYKGLNGTICRVMKVDYGKPSDPGIKLSLMEDIFSLENPPEHGTASSATGIVAEVPAPMAHSTVVTLPAYLALRELNPAATLDYPEVYAGVLAAQDGNDSIGYEMLREVVLPNGTTTWEDVGTKSLLGRALMATPLYAEAVTQVAGLPLLSQGRGPRIGGFVIFGDSGDADMEIGLLRSYNPDGTWTVDRGVLDTIPKYWPMSTPTWFLPANAVIADNDAVHSAGEEVEYKLLPRTSIGILPFVDAPSITGTLTARPHLPTRPANLKVNGVGFGEISATGHDTLLVTWATRNRLNEDGQIFKWTDGPITAEYLQESILIVTREDGTEIYRVAGLWTENSITLQTVWFAQERRINIRVISQRKGLTSMQNHGLWVSGLPYSATAAAPPPNPTPADPPPPPAPDADPTPVALPNPDPTPPTPGAGGSAPSEWYG